MNIKKKVEARKLPGFRDFFADDIQIREFVKNTFKQIFESYGYEPLETPALEYTDIFAGESGDEAEKLFFKFQDTGGRSVMLKYEVMISMCRAVAENINTLPLPYKRYQIQPVWRAERPQKGRYREFTQCDADTIGSSSVIWDAEFIQMGIETMQKLGFKNFKANISNRKFLNGLMRFVGVSDKDYIPVCLCIDKLPKVGKDEVKKELQDKRKIDSGIIDKIIDMITKKGDSTDLIREYSLLMKDIPLALVGLAELNTILKYLQVTNVDPEFYLFSPYIARGLAYYTGPIWEFEIIDGNVGSVAGCGRYDNTIGRFIDRQIPATGGSFGIERIVEVIKDRNMLDIKPTTVQILVTIFSQELQNNSIKTANLLRKAGLKTMLYSDPDKLDRQLKYADKKGIPYVVIIGPNEAEKEKIQLKNMLTKEQKEVDIKDIIEIIR